MFDSLRCAKKLIEAGFSREQAEAQVIVMTEVIETNLASKQDLRDVRQDIREFDTKVTNEFQLVRGEIREGEYRQTIRIGTIISIALGIAVALLKFL